MIAGLNKNINFWHVYSRNSVPGSSVDIATGYGLDGPRIESRWERDFPHPSKPALGPNQPPVQWVPGLSRGGVKSGQGVKLTPHPFLVPWSRKSRAIPLLPLWAVRPVQSLSACTTVHFTFTYTSTSPIDRTACTDPQCLYNGALYLYLYLYSPYGPYGLYRASQPVQRCSLPYLYSRNRIHLRQRCWIGSLFC